MKIDTKIISKENRVFHVTYSDDELAFKARQIFKDSDEAIDLRAKQALKVYHEHVKEVWDWAPLPEPRSAIDRPPGHDLIVFFQRFCSKSLFERVFEPVISDARLEYYEALQRGDDEDADKIGRELKIALLLTVVKQIGSTPVAWVGRVFLRLWKGG